MATEYVMDLLWYWESSHHFCGPHFRDTCSYLILVSSIYNIMGCKIIRIREHSLSAIFVLVYTHTHHERQTWLCNTVHTGTSQTSHITFTLCVAVIPMNDWRQVPASQPSLCSVPARQPRSNKKVAYFNRISLATETAAKNGTCGKLVCVSLDLRCSGFKQISYTFRIEYTALWHSIRKWLHRSRGFTVAWSLFINRQSAIYWCQSVNNSIPWKCQWNQYSPMARHIT